MESMRLVDFVDPEGHSFRLLALDDNDVLIPAFPGLQENFPKLKEFKFRDDDVIITTYPRSGTHLIWEIVSMLRNGSSDYIRGEKETDFLEMSYEYDLQNKKDRLINTHLTPELLPADWKNRKCKFVHVLRNPKDVMVSLYNFEIHHPILSGYSGKFSGYFERAMKGEGKMCHTKETALQMKTLWKSSQKKLVKYLKGVYWGLDEFFKAFYSHQRLKEHGLQDALTQTVGGLVGTDFVKGVKKKGKFTVDSYSIYYTMTVMYGNWITYELKYEQFFKSNPEAQALVLTYEDLLQDPVKNIKAVSEFLGLSRDDDLVDSIAQAVSFSKMKTGKAEVRSEALKKFYTDEEYSKIYRKGVAGDWKNWFTVAQNERYNAELQDRLKHSPLKSKIKWGL